MDAKGRGGPPARYRYRTVAILGPWRTTRELAAQDAVRADQAVLDASRPDGIRWYVPGTIEADRDYADEGDPSNGINGS